MKQSIFILLFAVFSSTAFAQQTIPQGMKYQAVARSLGGELLANRQVNLQISLLSMDADAQTFYSENHFATTNNLGLFELTIGQGKTTFGEFALVPWASEEIWIDFKIDENNTGDFKTVSTTRLLAVPYAFHAGTAGDIVSAAGQPGTEACPGGAATGTIWSTLTNCNTPLTAKLGTGDLKPLKLVTNNIERQRIDPDGRAYFHEDVYMDKDLYVADKGTIGRVHITGNNDGPGDDFESFSLQMTGSSQGMAIKVDGNVSMERIFLGCWDDGGMKGSISGLTEAELHASAEYQLQQNLFILQTVQIAADIVGLGAEITVVEVQILTFAEGVAIAAQLAAATVGLAALIVEWANWDDIQAASVPGISFNSGAADYAEWLERANPADDYRPGQVVGVKGGKISLETEGADHVMAISSIPIVLGNMPPKDRQAAFEKVAFMGQVKVRVVGQVRVGDFILASGKADGYAIAVSPDKMKLEDYDRIVGVAWEAGSSSISNLINVAVGINTNDMADRMAAQAREMTQMKAEMKDLKTQISQIAAFLKGETKTIGTPGPAELPAAQPTESAPVANAQPRIYSDEMLEKYRQPFEAKIKEIVAQFPNYGIDMNQVPAEAKAVFDNPVQAMKDLQNGKFGKAATEQFHKRQAERKAAGSGK